MTLPYIDQGPLFEMAGLELAGPNGVPTNPLSVAGGAVIATPILGLRCPADINFGQAIWTDRADVSPTPVAITNYKGVSGANWEWGNGLWNPGYDPTNISQVGLDWGNGLFYRSSGSGDDGFFGGGNPTPIKINFQMITDGTSNTFMIGESLPSQSEWTGAWAYSNNCIGTCAIYPNAQLTSGQTFATTDWGDNYSFHSNHSGGLHFAMADGTVVYVSNAISMPIYHALATRAGGESVALPD